MRVSLNLRDELIDQVQKLCPHKSIKQIIEEALLLYVISHQNQLSKFWGNVEIESDD